MARRFSSSTSLTAPFPVVLLNIILRFLQFTLGVAVIGLYAQDISNARKAHVSSSPKWAYAVAVGTLSAITAFIYVLPRLKSFYAFAFDWVLFALWTAVFGIFAKLYIHVDTHGNGDLRRMKAAVWVDLVNMLMWLITAVTATVTFFSLRGGRSLHTGRAAV